MFRSCLRSLSAEDLKRVDFNAGLAWQVGWQCTIRGCHRTLALLPSWWRLLLPAHGHSSSCS